MAVPRSSEDSSSSSLPLLRPKPQRHWQITPMSTEPPTPRSPSTDPPTAASTGPSADDSSKPVARSRSILNLTASTLFGIYASPTADSTSSFPDFSQVPTPWGHGAMTPASPQTPRESISEDSSRPLLTAAERAKLEQPLAYARDRDKIAWSGDKVESASRQLLNVMILLSLGMLHGGLVATLHDEEAHIIPIRLGVLRHHTNWHVGFWGVTAASAGWILPRLDRWWAKQQYERRRQDSVMVANGYSDARRLSPVVEGKGEITDRLGGPKGRAAGSAPLHIEEEDFERGIGWIGVIRTLGAFVGVIFLIRRLRWDPALQSSLTLALSNPVVWYVIDRSTTGLTLSVAAGVMGGAAVVGCGPDIVSWDGESYLSNGTAFRRMGDRGAVNSLFGTGSNRATEWPWGYENLALWMWVASALFYGVICFGNIGRMLSGSHR